MTYLISFSADYVGNNYVPTTRIYNANIVSEDYQLKCGESFSDEKPVISDNERVIDFTSINKLKATKL